MRTPEIVLALCSGAVAFFAFVGYHRRVHPRGQITDSSLRRWFGICPHGSRLGDVLLRRPPRGRSPRAPGASPTAPPGVAQRTRDTPMTGLVMVLITGAVSLSASVILSTRNMADVNDEVRAALCG